MIGNVDGSGWTAPTDSTYIGNINFQSDLTGKGYLGTQVDSAMYLFTGTEQIYFIDSTWNKTFSSASIKLVERNGTNNAPIGQVIVYTQNPSGSIPQGPFGSTGTTAQMQAAIDAWNARISGGSIVSNQDSIRNDSAFIIVDGQEVFTGVAVNGGNDGNGQYDAANQNGTWVV